ncbi:MAG TPA: hypothetical protein VHT52_15430 [Stellaceae bacterium]|jgi:hypothetical protein|nr:hypothetical protein [Stellaceae bacterium]
MARIIWDKRGNPTKYVSDRLGIQHWQLGDAIHELKAAGNLSPAERVIRYDDGTVTDESGYVLGNIHNEI